MRAVLDACVLYPTVMREILLATAEAGLFLPLWSERLLEEWRRAAHRNGGDADATLAETEAHAANLRFPGAMVPPAPTEALWLPDPADIHVLGTAVAGQADVIITMNLRDFPKRELAPHGLAAIHPDTILMDLWLQDGDAVAGAVAAVHARAEALSGEALDLRALLKRVRLPRLGKALG